MALIGFALICLGSIWAATTYNWIARYIGIGLALLGLLTAFVG